jgi:HAD superfamily hydrolase (TIGR01484 family)
VSGADGWAPRLVALDIDGTVANDVHEVTPPVLAAVGRARAAGAHVLLATGRSMTGARPVAQALGISRSAHVCSNGAVVARLDPDEILEAVTFDAGPIVRLLAASLPDALFAAEDLGRGHRVTRPFPAGELTGELRVCSLEELVEEPVTRLVVRQPDARAEQFLETVEALGLHGVNYVIGFTAWLDIAPDGVSKASGLARVAEMLGVARADVLAIGDLHNDVEMLMWAGRGVAMGQAPASVQEVADDVTDGFANDGAAVELDRWFA